jgi:PKD repeat protein
VSFDGANDAAFANVNLSNTPKATVEFWLKWDAFADDDSLAMELTPNFNSNAGGMLLDPNAPQENGKFGIGIGSGLSRNNAFFTRPSAGAWHHYAFVFDTTAGATNQITPYVDGQPVSYTKTATGTGAGNFANSQLYFMSRAAAGLFGAGDLDEVAVYNTALPGSIIANHYAGGTNNALPSGSFTATPSPAQVGQTVTFDASASTDSDGTIAKYEWDLDGDGTYETDTGTTPTVTKAYQTPGDVSVKLRVTDNAGGSGTATKTVTVQGTPNSPPTASFTASTTTPTTGQTVTYNASASSDSDGTIAKYEWDLDGNGSFETDTGTTKTVTKTYNSADAVRVQLRVTDNRGGTGKAGRTITIAGNGSSYVEKILATPGLLDYWRLSEAQGSTIFDRKGSNDATLVDGTFGALGALGGSGDSDAATSFDGVNDAAQAPVNLSGTSKVTVEFWLKWDAFADNDNLALEFTPNYNAGNGFIMDPNATLNGTGQFMVGVGADASRNLALFNRPSPDAWHHYAFVLDTTAPAASQITPYVDGQPVTFTKPASGTGAGAFANSTLYFMSRAARTLFGAGDLDELALYNGALSATTIRDHFLAGSQRAPSASFTATPSAVQTRQTVNFNAGASADPDGTIAKYEWDLDGDGTYETDTGTTATTSKVYDKPGTVNVGLRVTDNSGVTATTTRAVTVTSAYQSAVTGTTGLRGYWRLADTNSTVADTSGLNSTGSYSGSPPSFGPLIAGEQNNSHDFNGSTQYANMSPSALGTPTNVSAEAWVRTDTTKSSGNYHFLVTDSNSDFADGFTLAIDSGNHARFTVANSSSNTATATSSTVLTPGTVHHVVGTYDRSRVRIYVDGVERANVAYTSAISWSGSRDLYLGRAHATSSSTRFLDGKLDEAAVYNVALPAATVSAHYNAGKP